MVDGAGGKSQIAQLTAGLIVVVVLLFLTGALSYMPNAVLAAVVLLIGLRLVDIAGMRGIARVRTGEFVGRRPDGGDGRHRRHRAGHHPRHRALDHRAPGPRLQPVRHDACAQRRGRLETAPVRGGTVIQAAPGLVIYRFGAGLYYANATRFTEEVLAILDEADPTGPVVLPVGRVDRRRRLFGRRRDPPGRVRDQGARAPRS